MIITRGLGNSLLLTRGYGVSGIARIGGYIRIVVLTAEEYLRQKVRGSKYLSGIALAVEYLAQKLFYYELFSQYTDAREALKTKDRFEDSI